ncbi:MAG: SRPBCC domain-containing protein [Anaerolineaceae bacterium]|nr:SRPBCC domain-containing protein [Anaerolineaceae bacterium]
MDRDLLLSVFLSVIPEKAYQDWLDSAAHSAFTGSPAEIDAVLGGKFSAWEGYIWGKTPELTPGRRIRQAWRTSEFSHDSPDSILEVLFEPDGEGTRLTLIHTAIPDNQADEYEKGWEEFYFEPMRRYYKSKSE